MLYIIIMSDSNRSSHIVDQRHVFINVNLENARSEEALDTGRVSEM